MKALVAVVVLTVLCGGCSSSTPVVEAPETSSSTSLAAQSPSVSETVPSGRPSIEPTAQQQRAMTAAHRTLERYFAAWQEADFCAANSVLVVAQHSGCTPGGGLPRLSDWSIGNVTLDAWQSVERFRLYVDLDLHFDGDRGAWNEGENGRFVTAVQQPEGRYRLRFATSP